MSLFVVSIILVSCLMHASWNLLARRRWGDAVGFFFRMNLWVALLGLAPAVAAQIRWGVLDAKAWLLCTLSAVCLASYYLFLGKGYEMADLSTVYPVARALPVLLVMLVDVIRGVVPTPLGILGVALVVAGCLMAPLKSFGDMSIRAYWNKASVWIILTAAGTTGYTVLDKLASETANAGEHGALFALVYGYFFFAISTVILGVYLRVFVRSLRIMEHFCRWDSVSASIFNAGSYILIIWMYQKVVQTSYLVAFRQFSIVVGVVFAFILFNEPGKIPRTCAAVLITIGLVIVGLAG